MKQAGQVPRSAAFNDSRGSGTAFLAAGFRLPAARLLRENFSGRPPPQVTHREKARTARPTAGRGASPGRAASLYAPAVSKG